MTNLILLTALGSAASALFSWYLATWFWGTNYAKTNHNGDGGGPFGGLYAMIGGAFLSFFLILKVFITFIPADALGWVLAAVCLPSLVTGIWASFRSRK